METKFQVGDIVTEGVNNYEVVRIYGDKCDVKSDDGVIVYRDTYMDEFELFKKVKITNWQEVFE